MCFLLKSVSFFSNYTLFAMMSPEVYFKFS